MSRNKTILVNDEDYTNYGKDIVKLKSNVLIGDILNKIINQDIYECIDFFPDNIIDLLFIDPPYNLNKKFNGNNFYKKSKKEYAEWFESWFIKLIRLLKKDSSIYICGDWNTSHIIHSVVSNYLIVKNRITFEREKGRGAEKNFKNCSEDIYFYTMSDDYYFDVDSVKLMKKVIAPYKDIDNNPKDWKEEENGKFRLTYPSNIWTDITIPFWSMSENTEHPTQKPEKLLAKIILASSKESDFIFDLFCGSGTTLVTAKKLNRNYCGIDIDNKYCILTAKRLEMVNHNRKIQGFEEGIFYERNFKI